MKTNKLIANFSINFGRFLFKPFQLYGVNPVALERNINLVRVIFGLGMLHRYVDILGFSILTYDNQGFFPIDSSPAITAARAIYGIVLSLLIASGFLTPVALFLLLLFMMQFVYYLGPQVAGMLIWGLILLGAGRSYSIDSLLLKRSRFKKIIKWIYLFTLEPKNPTRIPDVLSQARFFVLLLFWGVCVSAMSYHFLDPLWLQGKVLQLLFLTPYLTDHYTWLTEFANKQPVLYDIFGASTIYIQGVWELFLFPLMYFPWGRVFVLIWGLGFFIQSFFMMNLGYLPFIEICMWTLIFNYSPVLNLNTAILYYDDRCNLCRRTVVVLKIFDFYEVLEVKGLSIAPEIVQAEMGDTLQIALLYRGNVYTGYRAYQKLCSSLFPFLLLYPIIFLGNITNLGSKVYQWIA
ncbi:MAG: DCC1-like thiol-disulfide oxidoreductase family protein, partial [Cyanobacteria bacterium P01_G01_bin.54]